LPGAAKRNRLIDGHIIADDRGFTDHHTHAMVDEKIFPNGCARMDFNTGKKNAPAGRSHAPEA
jgi:hypothetical protein